MTKKRPTHLRLAISNESNHLRLDSYFKGGTPHALMSQEGDTMFNRGEVVLSPCFQDDQTKKTLLNLCLAVVQRGNVYNYQEIPYTLFWKQIKPEGRTGMFRETHVLQLGKSEKDLFPLSVAMISFSNDAPISAMKRLQANLKSNLGTKPKPSGFKLVPNS